MGRRPGWSGSCVAGDGLRCEEEARLLVAVSRSGDAGWKAQTSETGPRGGLAGEQRSPRAEPAVGMRWELRKSGEASEAAVRTDGARGAHGAAGMNPT